MEQDYAYDEGTILSLLIYSENIDKDFVKMIFNRLTENMFFNREAKLTFELFKDLCSGEDIELLGTSHLPKKMMQIAMFENPGLDIYIMNIEGLWTPRATYKYWVKKIQDKYFEERYREAKCKEDYQEIIKEEQMYYGEDDLVSISDNAIDVLDEYDKRKDTAIFTPYKKINDCIGSIQGGDMIILAGSTGGGKTCFALNLAIGIAKAGKKVDFFSLEMPKYQLQQRIICSEVGIDAKKFRNFQLSKTDREKYTTYANNDFKKLNIKIFRQQTVNIGYVKTIEERSDSDIVFIDYLGLLDGGKGKSTYDKFSDISREIKLMAMSCNKPVIALHQLNRVFQEREDKRPKTSDLRDSGKIEQDADMIWFVFRPYMFDPTANKEDLYFIVGKNRHGECKDIKLVFNGNQQRITEPMEV